MPTVEVCFSPALFPFIRSSRPYVVVVTDVLRATTAMCAAISAGVEKIIPVATLDEAREYKKKGFPVAAERDGSKLGFADYGNSPFDYQTPEVKGISLVYTTTNGTIAIDLARDAEYLTLGAFVNLGSLYRWLHEKNMDVVILCSGWMNTFSLEDAVFAGALTDMLVRSGGYTTNCDSAMASLVLWEAAEGDPKAFLDRASHRKRLHDLGVDDSVAYCFSIDMLDVVPGLKNGVLVNLNTK
jgi:2-phosphosulfolactate phosphatase